MKYHDLLNLIIAIFFSALIFSLFDISKYFFFLITAAFFFLVSYFTKFLVARRLGFEIRTKLISFKRLGFQYQSPFPIPAWLIFPLLFSLISYNALKILTILGTYYKPLPKRLRYKFELDEYDMAKISMISIIACLFFTILFYYLGFYEIASFGAWFVVSNLIPLGSLDGSRIFYGSWLAWIFIFVFCAIELVLIHLVSPLISIIIGILFAFVIFIYFLYQYLI